MIEIDGEVYLSSRDVMTFMRWNGDRNIIRHEETGQLLPIRTATGRKLYAKSMLVRFLMERKNQRRARALPDLPDSW